MAFRACDCQPDGTAQTCLCRFWVGNNAMTFDIVSIRGEARAAATIDTEPIKEMKIEKVLN